MDSRLFGDLSLPSSHPAGKIFLRLLRVDLKNLAFEFAKVWEMGAKFPCKLPI